MHLVLVEMTRNDNVLHASDGPSSENMVRNVWLVMPCFQHILTNSTCMDSKPQWKVPQVATCKDT